MRAVVPELKRVLAPQDQRLLSFRPTASIRLDAALALGFYVVGLQGVERHPRRLLVQSLSPPHGALFRNYGLMRPAVKMCVWLGPPMPIAIRMPC